MHHVKFTLIIYLLNKLKLLHLNESDRKNTPSLLMKLLYFFYKLDAISFDNHIRAEKEVAGISI